MDERSKPSSLIIPVLMFSAFLVGCGGSESTQSGSALPINESPGDSSPLEPVPPSNPIYKGEPELAKYVYQFIDNAKSKGMDVLPHMKGPELVVKIEELGWVGSSTIGLCQSSSTRRIVTVDKSFWNKSTEATREILMHHELGHCVLDRRHTSKRLPSGAYASIMTPYILKATTYTSSQAYYQDELFANANISSEDGVLSDGTDICNLDE